MKDNHGMSLIELIVVMAILSILAASAIISTRILYSADAKSIAREINDMLEVVKTENMTKSKRFYMVIEKDDGKYYLLVERLEDETIVKVISRKELSIGRGEITFMLDDNTYLISDVSIEGKMVRDRLEISFDKASGSVIGNMERPGEIVTQIGITTKGGTNEIRLVKLTGKHYIE